MCGIFGITSSEDTTFSSSKAQRTFNSLLLLSESRGKEAAGLAARDSAGIHIYKTPCRAQEMLKQLTYQQLTTRLFNEVPARSLSLIGHSRLATNGSHLRNTNNQPTSTPHLVGIHNGICVNYEELWQKVSTIKKRTELDTEALFAILDEAIQKGESVEHGLKALFRMIAGSATIAAYHTHLNHLILATNTGSLFYIQQDNDYFIFSSERYILTKICEQENLNPQNILNLSAGRACLVDLTSMRLKQFSLDKSSQKSLKQTYADSIYERRISDHSVRDPKKSSAQLSVTNKLSQLMTHQPNYAAINQLRRCTHCILPGTMPLISFDEKGVCNYCRNHTKISYQGAKSLKELVAPFRRTDGQPDCIVAFSGGRDSSYGLHYLKKELGLHPIAYTYDWGMITDLGRRNQARMVGELGVEHIIVSADIKKKRDNIRKNILAWLKKPDLGMVPLFMAGDKQAEFYAEELKRKTGIKLVFYCRGNELENEEFKWGHCGITNGSPQGVLHNLSLMGKMQLASYYGTQFLRNPSYLNSSLIDTAFAYAVAYFMPLDFVYLWHYIPWDEKQIETTLQKSYGWESEENSTWRIDDGSVAFYNYIFYKMQGFTENDTFRSNQIREGILTRKKALSLVAIENQPRHKALQWYFDTLHLDGAEVLAKIDSVSAF